jgi:hypothetical protein
LARYSVLWRAHELGENWESAVVLMCRKKLMKSLLRCRRLSLPMTCGGDCAASCQAHQRDRLERLCRYITRPALCLEQLSTNAAGQVV